MAYLIYCVGGQRKIVYSSRIAPRLPLATLLPLGRLLEYLPPLFGSISKPSETPRLRWCRSLHLIPWTAKWSSSRFHILEVGTNFNQIGFQFEAQQGDGVVGDAGTSTSADSKSGGDENRSESQRHSEVSSCKRRMLTGGTPQHGQAEVFEWFGSSCKTPINQPLLNPLPCKLLFLHCQTAEADNLTELHKVTIVRKTDRAILFWLPADCHTWISTSTSVIDYRW